MNCRNCGSVLPDNAVKCDVCGLKVPKKGPGVAAQRLKMIGIGAGVGLVMVGALAVPAFMNSASAQSSTQSSRVANDLVTQSELVVPVQASGLDASGSRIAVHVKGLTSGGTSVEQDGFVNHEGKGLSLEQGMYEVTVVGSPISSTGVIYNLPTTNASVEVTANGGSSYTASSSLMLTPIDAAAVTDEQIEAARQWVLKDSERALSADQLAEAARQRRAAAQKAADSAKKEKEDKQEGADSQSNQSDQSNQSNESDQSSGDSSYSSGQSSEGSSSQSDDSSYSYYGGNYGNTQSYYGGNATESNTDSGAAPAQTTGGDAQPNTSQDGGGQQVDPAPADSSSGGGSSTSDSGGSSSDQGSSSSSAPAQSGSGGASASANAPTA